MFDRGQRILDYIFDIQIRPYLVQVLAQVDNLGVGEHDKLHARGRLVVVQLVFAGAVGEKGVVSAAQFGDEVAQGEDEAKDELLVVAVGQALADRDRRIASACDAGSGRRAGGLGARGGGSWCPAAGVDALRWEGAISNVQVGCNSKG